MAMTNTEASFGNGDIAKLAKTEFDPTLPTNRIGACEVITMLYMTWNDKMSRLKILKHTKKNKSKGVL